MFTGIVETVGRVTSVDRTDGGMTIAVMAPGIVQEMAIGDSIAVNGTCLTAVRLAGDLFEAEAVLETIAKTNLGDLVIDSPVNLERPMAASGRFDGHIVQGHVDGVGEVLAIEPEGDGLRLRISVPDNLMRYIVDKGSITVDGVSLTVAALGDDHLEIAIIPHTMDVTVLGVRAPGDRVNLEVDVIAKYVERMMEAKQ